jgi:hypothetical protein
MKPVVDFKIEQTTDNRIKLGISSDGQGVDIELSAEDAQLLAVKILSHSKAAQRDAIDGQ